MPSIADIISIAKISQYLSANAIAKAGLYSAGIDRKLPRKLYCARKSVSWLYDQDPDDDTLASTANYLFALCAPYSLEAQAILGSGGNAGVIAGGGAAASILSPILVTSDYFTNETEWDGTNGAGVVVQASYTLQVFWNDANRFLLQGSEWVRTATGFQILIGGFDATVNDYTLFVYISA